MKILNKAALKEDIIRLEEKLDRFAARLYEELLSIKELDLQQNAILSEHAKRSDGLEKDNLLREERLRMELDKIKQDYEKIAIPIKLINIVKISLVWAGSLSLGLLSILKLIKYL